MPYINNEIYYEVFGEGRALILIHGAWASHEWWRMQIPEFSKYYKVIALDVRGHGKSVKLEKPTTVEKLAEDLDLLLKHLNIEEVALAGWSMGGMIATQYYFMHPEKVKALIMLASRLFKRPKMLMEAYLRVWREMLTMFMDFADFEGFESSRYEDLVRREIEKTFHPNTPQEVKEWAIKDLTENRRREYLNLVKTLSKYDASKKLREIKVPTLIMAGDKDDRVPLDYVRRAKEMIPNSKLIILEGYGHYFLLEVPEIVNKEILEFLKNIGYY
ncbi:MAG: alpha/beta hydrolase [Aigarchaeota archaeon]|nr:alpha/beta hydrolase [Aigarchaeota archaeon]MCX8192775.1 alpha/beta hydrolase [Nitrososphaeria archaeon]MDW7986022.1 alpha/beta hydrolase [Nitrososphaerota archaeon]